MASWRGLKTSRERKLSTAFDRQAIKQRRDEWLPRAISDKDHLLTGEHGIDEPDDDIQAEPRQHIGKQRVIDRRRLAGKPKWLQLRWHSLEHLHSALGRRRTNHCKRIVGEAHEIFPRDYQRLRVNAQSAASTILTSCVTALADA